MSAEPARSVRDDDALWRALANPVRRTILDLLRDGPRTTGALAREFEDDLTRFAVMQHLEVLTEAGLVTVRRAGRRRFNHLNAVPLREAYERWVSRLAGGAARAALALRDLVEKEETMGAQAAGRAIHLANEIEIAASPETVFEAATDRQREWYPYSYGQDRLEGIVFEHRVGGRVYEDWGNGAGTLYGTVAHYDPPHVYCTRGHLKGGITLEQWYEAERTDDGGTLLKQTMVAFGDISEEMAEAIRSHGDLSRFADEFRGFCERLEKERTA